MDDSELRRRLYVPNFEHWKSLCDKNYYSKRLPSVQTLADGIILPAKMKPIKDEHRYKGGVCDRDFKFVAGYSNIAPGKLNGWCCLDESYTVERKEIVECDEEVIWGGALICHFGHFITESMSRMWYVAEHPELTQRVAFVKVNTWKVGDWIYQFLDLLGLPKDRVLIIDKPTQFRSIIIPDQSSRIKFNYNDKLLVPFKKMASSVTPRDIKKIFLTRGKDLKSQMYLANADYFEEFYRQRGYEIVAPEKLSAAEQVALITGAEEIVCHMGTLAHWSLFSRPNVKWTFLTRVDSFTSRQCLINVATGIDWYLVSTSMNFMHSDQGGGVCLIGATEYWRQYVLDHHHEQLGEERIPSWVFDDYVRHWTQYFLKPDRLETRVKTFKKIYGRLSMLEMQLKLKRPVLCFELHQARKGWLPLNLEGDAGGVLHEKLSVQAIKIYFSEPFFDVKYAVYYPKEGWSEVSSTEEIAGTVGKNKAIHGLCATLDAEGSAQFDIVYRVHNFNDEWSTWSGNGAQAVSNDHALDGVQIILMPKRK
ncbi:MAG: glycosyltransferase family 61 protein [Selenomonadaceae bacterium]|nr:glycosyltransferase family 61 protein [Selenomonadaceae bacterium]